MTQTVSRPLCDVCGSDARQPAGSYEMQVPAHPLSGSHWNLWRCTTCRLVYVDPRPTEQIFGGFVPDLAGHRAANRMWRRRLRTMDRFHPPGRLLDVGAGGGEFLLSARASGWDVCGLDVQEEFARGITARTGFPIHVGELDDPEIQSQSFDAVTLWDVIEHVPSPRSTLAAASRVLPRGGLLAVSTINGHSINARLFRGAWVFWNRPGRVPEHLQAFAPSTLEYALRDAGFRPVAVRTYFSAGAIIEPLERLLKPGDRLGGRWRDFRHSTPGRAAAFALWRATAIAGRPLDILHLGDLLEVYAVRV